MAGHGHAHTLPVEEAHADAWHHHESAEGLPQVEHGAETNMVSLTAWAVALVVAVVGAIAVIWIYFNSYSTQEKARKQEVFMSAEAMQYKARVTDQEFKSYGWSDASTNSIRVPLNVAKDKVISKYANTK
jgi:hypothetical protein